MKRDVMDDLFSKLVRRRADWTCERCGKYCGETHDGGRLDCSHIFSRRHVQIRWDSRNAQAMCFKCHQWFGERPAESGPWVISVVGEDVIDELRERLQCSTKITKADKEAIKEHLRSQWKDGVIGFTGQEYAPDADGLE